jgi:hypothetical protein
LHSSLLAVDAYGFHGYPDGFAYKRIMTSVDSLTAARTVCSNELNSSLVIPYMNSWVDLAIERLVQPGDQFYIGITASNIFQPSEKIFVTDKGKFNQSKH